MTTSETTTAEQQDLGKTKNDQQQEPGLPRDATGDEWDAKTEEGFALAVAPVMRELADMVKAKLPAGTDFGVLVVAPNSDSRKEGRVLAVTTDRTRMATYAAQWVLTVLNKD